MLRPCGMFTVSIVAILLSLLSCRQVNKESSQSKPTSNHPSDPLFLPGGVPIVTDRSDKELSDARLKLFNQRQMRRDLILRNLNEEQILAVTLSLLEIPDEKIRIVAVKALPLAIAHSSIPREKAIQLLIGAYRKESKAHVQQAILGSLGSIKDDRNVIRRFLQDVIKSDVSTELKKTAQQLLNK